MAGLLSQQKLRFQAASITNKITVIVAVCSLLSLVLIALTSIVREHRSTTRRELDRLSSMASILASNSVASLHSNDPATAAKLLSSLRAEKNVTCAVLFDARGLAFAEYHRDEGCPRPASPPELGPSRSRNAFSFAEGVERDGRQLGILLLGSDKLALRDQVLASLLAHGIALLCGLAISILLARRLLPLITKPLRELVTLTRRVSEERNYTLRARKRHDDELGLLVDSVNFMLATVRQRDEAINATNQNLEQLVAERTAQLVEAREKAESALEAKSDFLATMTHELRTPMNAIIGMSSVLHFEDLDAERSRQIEIIRKSAVNLLDLVNDILDFSKIDANRLDLENRPFDLLACIEEAMDIAAAANRNNRLVYCATIEPTLPAYLKGDVIRLRQILVNLLSNAFKFTAKGSVTLDATRLPADRNTAECIQICVRDTGIGIPDDQLERIFDSFTQANQSTSRQYGGTGLGLTISYRLALAMGGAITAESELGTGSEFRLTLPIQRADGLDGLIAQRLVTKSPPAVKLLDLPKPLDVSLRGCLQSWGCKVLDAQSQCQQAPTLSIASALANDELQAVERATRLAAPEKTLVVCHPDHASSARKATGAAVLTLPIRQRDLRNHLLSHIDTSESPRYDAANPFGAYPTEQWSGLRILLAEDNELSRNVFIHHMELIGLDIETAPNGAVAVERAQEREFDIIFMDVRMPVKDGLQASREIRERQESGPRPWIVGFTANTESAGLEEIEAAGMDDYLAKPALISDIADAITRYCFQRTGEAK